MSAFLYRLGRQCYRRHGRVFVAWLLVVLVAGGLAGLAAATGAHFDDQFTIPGASSQQALQQLQRTFPEVGDATANLVVEVPAGQRVDAADTKASIERALSDIAALRDPKAGAFVLGTTSPFDPQVTGLLAPDGRAAIGQVRVAGSVATITDAERAAISDVAARLQGEVPGSTVVMGGEVYSVSLPRLGITEFLGLGVAVVVLLATLGISLAAGLPVLTAVIGAAISMALLFAATALAPINSTTPMLALMLGVAVGIDYALFILSRHRDQLAGGMDPEESAAEATATAGSAVVFAGLTVIIALVGLTIVGIPFLGTMGLFASLAVAIAVIIAVTLLPALMGLWGERMRPRRSRAARRAEAAGEGATPARDPHRGPSGWWVRTVTRLPLLTILLVVVGLGALTIPARGMTLALPNAGHHAPTSPERRAYDITRDHFGVGYNGPLIITVNILQAPGDPRPLLADLQNDIKALPGVASVPVATPNRTIDTGILQVIPTTSQEDPRTTDLVKLLRSKESDWKAKYGVDTAVTGFTAVQIDVTDRLAGALLPFGVFVVGLSLILLAMVFRSIWVPITASLGYLLSVGAAFGATTLVFNRGWGRQAINLAETQPIISFFPVILMGILFGLAMDYQVFLVSRMREEHVHGDDARAAVKDGFVHSAKVVVAAALIMFSVFAFFVPGGDGPIKPIAFGLAIGVAIDAFLVRMTLIPAIMHLLGERAWWLPRWLERAMPVMDIEGEGLRRQLELADWPRPGDDHAVYAEGLAARAGSRTLFEGVDLALQPGDVAVVEGPPAARAALLLGLTGRLALEGRAKVAGRVLATQGAEIRPRTRYVDAATPDPEREWAGAADLIVVDDADRVAEHHRDGLTRLAANLGRAALVVGAADPAQLVGVLPNSAQIVDLTGAPRPARAADPATRPADDAARPATDRPAPEGTRHAHA